MAATMLLPEDARDTEIVFDLPKALAPYARALLAEAGREGENLAEFACRQLCVEAVRFAMRNRLEQLRQTRETNATLDEAALAEEHGTLLSEV